MEAPNDATLTLPLKMGTIKVLKLKGWAKANGLTFDAVAAKKRGVVYGVTLKVKKLYSLLSNPKTSGTFVKAPSSWSSSQMVLNEISPCQWACTLAPQGSGCKKCKEKRSLK